MADIAWRYDTSNSRTLRVLVHLPYVAMGGPVALLVAVAAIGIAALPDLSVASLALLAVLVLVGGPASLLYLWPMLADPDQRPSPRSLGWDHWPFTVRSVLTSLSAGGGLFVGLAALGAPVRWLYGLFVALVGGSAILASALRTVGRVDGETLTVGAKTEPLAHVADVGSVTVGDVVLAWLTWTKPVGSFPPRLLAIPAESADDVLARIERGAATPVDADNRETSVAARLVLVGLGALVLGVGALVSSAIDERGIRIYFLGAIGLVGLTLGLAGWRGV